MPEDENALLADSPPLGRDKHDRPAGKLDMELHPLRMTIGSLEATLSWRLLLRNAGQTHLVALRIASDLACAMALQVNGDQLSGPEMSLARTQRAKRIDPGAEMEIAGENAIPLSGLKPIVKNGRHMILPIMRLRIVGAGIAPLRRAFLVGKPPALHDERLRPVQLEKDGRVLTELSARLVAPATDLSGETEKLGANA